MAKVYSTGPVLIYTNVLTGGPAFLGTGQQAPNIQVQPQYEHVMNDIMGTKHPADRLYEGEEAVSSVVLNRYNEAHLEACMARPRPGGSTAGTNSYGEVGTLMNAEGCSYIVWLFFPYAPKPFQVADAVQGYRFPYSFLLGPESIGPGTKDKQVSIVFQHTRGLVIGSSASSGYSTILYDHDMTVPKATGIN